MAQDQKAGGAVMDRLKSEARGLVGALGDRALSSVQDKVQGATGRLSEYVEGGAGPGLMAAVTGAKDTAEGKGPVRSMLGAGLKGTTEKIKEMFGKGGKGGKGKKLKVTNIVESIDVGVPIDLAYDQWTQFTDFSGFMKKVENVDQVEDEKLHWKAQIFWSHREWDADIIEQVPDERIIWRSKVAKGHVDGAVTFHELSPEMTRILLVLEYHPQGLFEHTGNLWRAQGRRARLELKHFQRHVMTNAILHADEIEGWRGVIEDGEVVQDHESALDEEERNGEEPGDRSQERAAGDREQDGGADEDFADDQDAYSEEELVDEEEPEDKAEPEDADIEPDGEANGDRPARRTRAARVPARSGRSGGTTQRSGGSTRTAERPRRPARSGTTRRGENQ